MTQRAPRISVVPIFRTAFLLILLVASRVDAQVAPTDPIARTSARERTQSGQHSADGRREAIAAPAKGNIKIDGVLDEEVWKRAEPASDFVQSEPLEGQPGTEKTEVRVAYDADNLYIAAKLFDGNVAGLIVNDIKKDFREEDQDDFEVLLDTFGDRRNGYVFSTNIEGARHDRQVALEGREINQSWDAVWEVRTRVESDGWTVEMRIPFRALRFDPVNNRAWGVNFSRHIRRKNEVVFWSPVPRAYNLNRVSLGGNLAGLQTGSAGRDLRIKPYIATSSIREVGTTSVPKPVFGTKGDIGVDIRAALTPGITMDVTVNPDFGQVEADEQQVNLTQFSQFYPEKRDFFLENSGVFYVGDAARNNRVNPTPTPDEDNLLFFSRRIGLTSGGAQLPILGGIRLTGKLTTGMRVGLLTMQEREDGLHPAVNSSVLRVRQNLGKVGNDVGFFLLQTLNTSGSDTGQVQARSNYFNRVFGVDNNYRLFGNLDWNSYVVKTETPGIASGDYAWRSTLNWEGNFYHGKGGVMQLGSGFQNDLGYYRRTGVRKYLLDTGLRPRSPALRAHGIREFHPHVVWDYQENLRGDIVGKRLHTGWSTFLNSGAVFELSVNPVANRLELPFRPNANMKAAIDTGLYKWNEWGLFVISDQSKVVSTSMRVTIGGLYTGTQRTISGTVTIRPTYKFRSTFGIQRTAAELKTPNEKFVNSVYTARANYSFTTNMFVDALSQYDITSKQFNANVRFNLIHHPLSDIFLVYNDQRFLTDANFVTGRSLILKVTQMFSF
jgi:hypothetical protein